MSSYESGLPWDRRPDESPKYYKMFLSYIQQGIQGRSQERVAVQFGFSLNHINKCSSRFEWARRAEAYDLHNLAADQAAIEAEREQRRQVWAQQHADRAIDIKNLEYNASYKFLSRAMEIACQPLPHDATLRDACVLADTARKIARDLEGLPNEIAGQTGPTISPEEAAAALEAMFRVRENRLPPDPARDN